MYTFKWTYIFQIYTFTCTYRYIITLFTDVTKWIICPCVITCTLVVFSTRSYAIVVIEHAHGKTTIFSYTKPMITKFNKRYQFSLISFCSTVWIFKFLVRQLKKRCISEDKLLKLISENILCAEIHCKTWYLYAMHMTFYYDVNFNQIYTIHVYV